MRPLRRLVPLVLLALVAACADGPGSVIGDGVSDGGGSDDGGGVPGVDTRAPGNPDGGGPEPDAWVGQDRQVGVDEVGVDGGGGGGGDGDGEAMGEDGGVEAGPPADDAGVPPVDVAAPPVDPTPDAGTPPPPPADGPNPRKIRVMTYNIKRGSVTSIDQIGAVIRAQDPDVVGLQEVFEGTGTNTRSNATRLGELTGLNHVFRAAKPVSGGEFGNAVLSRFPVIDARRVLLTSGTEQRILLLVRVRLPDRAVLTVATSHFGLSADERPVQAAEVRDEVRGRPLLTFTGDLNSFPTGAVHQTLTGVLDDTWAEAGSGAGNTSPAGTPRNRIDYIYRSRDFRRAENARVIDTQASDHRPVVVDLVRRPAP